MGELSIKIFLVNSSPVWQEVLKEMKIELIAVIITLVIIFGGEYLFYSIYTLPFVIKETKEIWTPEKFQIANNFDGSSLIVAEYKNDMAKNITFSDLQTLYDFTYSNENFTIIAQQNGTIWYKWSFKGFDLMAADYRLNLSVFPHEGSITDTSRDGQKAYVTIVLYYSWGGGLVYILIYLGIIALGLLIGWISYSIGKEIKPKPKE